MSNTPLFDKIDEYARRRRVSFAMPGHKGGKGLDRAIQHNPFRLDVTELSDTEDLYAPSHALSSSRQAAAEFFGAQDTFFLVNGSTAGIYAMLAASCSPGDTVLVNRACHTSVINACVMLGLSPVFIKQDIIDSFAIPAAINQKNVADMLDKYPNTKAVLVTSPSYYGLASDLSVLAKITHTRGIPLLVDEAHGAHFAVDESIFPKTAMSQGADLSVQSAHKTLNALNQASYLHYNSDIIDKDRVRDALRMLQTSSPSYLIASSADLARGELVSSGKRMWNALFERCENLREKVAARTKVKFMSMLMNSQYNIEKVDETRIVMNFSAYKTTGFEVSDMLREDYGIDVEMADLLNIVCIATPANTQSDFAKLERGVTAICDSLAPAETEPAFPPPPIPDMAMTPQKAFYSKSSYVRLDEAVGCVSRSTVIAYPPAVPIICAGELVTGECAGYISALMEVGAKLIGLNENGFISIVE